MENRFGSISFAPIDINCPVTSFPPVDKYAILVLCCYIVGSIPFGLILARIFGYGDIRKIGSGNIGTTNVLRTGNKGLAALTLLFDALKGFSIILLFLYLFPSLTCRTKGIVYSSYQTQTMLYMGLFAILGHCFPIWLKFKGGKGVATGLGALLAAVPYAGLAACAAWIATAKISKYSSLSALIAFLIAPIVTLFMYGSAPAAICALITLLIWVRHKDNIKRLLKGEEPKIGQKKKEETVDPVSE